VLRRYRTRELSVQEFVEQLLRRIDRMQPELNCFITVMVEEAQRRARELDRELTKGKVRRLHGVPVAVKDNTAINGMPMTGGSKLLMGRVSEHDAPCVARLRRAGAIFVGTTNLHELAFGAGDAGFGEVANPVDAAYSCSGSSSGSASAVGAELCLGAIATDTGGSIRVPAALVGVVGLKPSAGRISTDGVIPVSSSLDHVGPMARTVRDAAELLDVMTVTTRGAKRLWESDQSGSRSTQLRIAVLDDRDLGPVDSSIREALVTACDALSRGNASIHSVRLPEVREALPTMTTIAHAECGAYHGDAFAENPGQFGATARTRLAAAQQIRAVDYVEAQRRRAGLRSRVDDVLSDVDALLLPATATTAFVRGTTEVRVADGPAEPVSRAMSYFTPLFNLTGHPAVVVPVGMCSNGLPVSIQLVGKRNSDETLLYVADVLQALAADRSHDKQVAVAGVGGHKTPGTARSVSGRGRNQSGVSNGAALMFPERRIAR
jgi:aspartyl-tRNA(Asn)/glutamyl-tRNA(Gln) amidotransferase subunit A